MDNSRDSGRVALYKELGQDTSNDVDQPNSFKLDYVDNDNNTRVKNKALADKSLKAVTDKSLDEFVGRVSNLSNHAKFK